MVIRDQDTDQIAILEIFACSSSTTSPAARSLRWSATFRGCVQSALPSMEAAFVDAGRGRNAVLYAGEVNWDAVGMGGQAPVVIEAGVEVR